MLPRRAPSFLGILLACFGGSVLTELEAAPFGALQQEDGAEDERIEELVRRFDRAGRGEREELYAELSTLLERHPSARDEIGRALEKRSARAVGTLLRSKVRGSLEALVERRRALDLARAHALVLILDPQRFFYPFQTPEVEPDRARLYSEVRADVLARIEAVRAIWTEKTTVAVPAPARDAWEELAWLRPRASLLGIDLAPGPEVPLWLVAQCARFESISVRELALDDAEGIAFDRDRAVLARNEALWAAQPEEGPSVASKLECEEVRLTNEYRRMMGRRALAWNPHLQEAARTHSEYMVRTGELGHGESIPGREDPFSRMRAAGYAKGLTENCYFGAVVPLAAHDQWLGSSMHHRNILDEEATEIASGLSGTYWTQDYGSDRAFEPELVRW